MRPVLLYYTLSDCSTSPGRFLWPILRRRFLADARRFWYGERMETNPFDLTPQQKGLLVTLAQETGKPIPALIAEALDELQEHVHPHGEKVQHPTPDQMTKPLWEIADDLLKD